MKNYKSVSWVLSLEVFPFLEEMASEQPPGSHNCKPIFKGEKHAVEITEKLDFGAPLPHKYHADLKDCGTQSVFYIHEHDAAQWGLYHVSLETFLLSRHPLMPHGLDAKGLCVYTDAYRRGWYCVCGTIGTPGRMRWKTANCNYMGETADAVTEVLERVKLLEAGQSRLLTMLEEMYYAPGMPGHLKAQASFQALQPRKRKSPPPLDAEEEEEEKEKVVTQ